ncbi:hypothetical protein T439DRAFT_357879 [Meredithblackwellia eburnea MCA 4105]
MKVDPKDYHKYYLKAPTSAQWKEYHDNQQRAFEQRLKTGDVLAWNGPNLFPDTLPVANPTSSIKSLNHNINIPHHLRQPLSSLLLSPAPALGGQGWWLRLVQPIQEGKHRTSQIWRCDVIRKDNTSLGSVALKLRQQSLFMAPSQKDSKPEFGLWNWTPAEYYVARESHVYLSLRKFQGRILPICYGFYDFKLPSGEECVGMVMEDLTSNTDALFSIFKRERKSGPLSPEFFTPSLFEIFRAQKALHHEFGFYRLVFTLENVLVIQETMGQSQPSLIFVGFGHSVTAAWAEESRANFSESQKGKVGYNPDDLTWDWQEGDQDELGRAFAFAAGDSFRKWTARNQEKIKDELPFLLCNLS